MAHYYFGLDLGQKRDHTAIAVIEFEEPVLARLDYVSYLRRETKLDPTYSVRYLRRVPLGTSYPAIVAEVRDLTRRPEVRRKCTLVVDGTGVGAAVVDLLREADLDCDVVPVSITSGSAARRDGGWWYVPKKDLIGVVQVLLEQERLKFSEEIPELRRLMDEFMEMRVRVGEKEMQFGTWREGAHDDMALAVTLACWRAQACGRGVGERGDGRLM